MAAASKFTADQKRAYVKVAKEKGREAACKAAGVSTHTVSAWAKELGISLGHGPKAKKKRATSKANGHRKTNGHEITTVPVEPAPSIEGVRAQLQTALASLNAFQKSWQKAFGG